jgi:4-aminobutyrate aminotransferase-like enzyme
MTSTHTGNPVCCAAALASINLILSEDLAGNAKRLGIILQDRLAKLKQRFTQIGVVMGKGLVAAVSCVKPGTREPDADLAWDVVRGCVDAGVLMFSPVGPGGGTVKISPPLVITEEALTESLSAFEEVFSNTVSARNDALKTPVSV